MKLDKISLMHMVKNNDQCSKYNTTELKNINAAIIYGIYLAIGGKGTYALPPYCDKVITWSKNIADIKLLGTVGEDIGLYKVLDSLENLRYVNSIKVNNIIDTPIMKISLTFGREYDIILNDQMFKGILLGLLSDIHCNIDDLRDLSGLRLFGVRWEVNRV